MIDNFNLIEPLFYFNESDNMFFHCQIVQRAKDHPEKKVRERSIQTYLIRSKSHLYELKDEIILLCNYYKARAYINVAGKDFIEVNKLLLNKLAFYNYNNNIQAINPSRLLNSCLGEIISKKPIWIIDIDDLSIKDDVYQYFKELGDRNYEIVEIPTVQGYHLLTTKFNTSRFQSKFPNIDIHKNSMGTLLYCPNINYE